MTKGFTLIETVIYLTLLSVLMGGVVGAVYQLTKAQSKLEDKTATQQEMHFVMRKLVWMLDDVTNIVQPTTAAPYSSSLVVTKRSGEEVRLRFNPVTQQIEIQNGGSGFLPLTTNNVKVQSMQFRYIASLGGNPGIEASTTIDAITIETKRFLR